MKFVTSDSSSLPKQKHMVQVSIVTRAKLKRPHFGETSKHFSKARVSADERRDRGKVWRKIEERAEFGQESLKRSLAMRLNAAQHSEPQMYVG